MSARFKTPRFDTVGEFFVETWFDRRSRSYVTQLSDANHYQIGEAHYCGTRDGAKLAHSEVIASASIHYLCKLTRCITCARETATAGDVERAENLGLSGGNR